MVTCVFLAQAVILFTACLIVTPLNLSSPSTDLVTSDYCLLSSLTAVSALFDHGVDSMELVIFIELI